MCQMFTATVSNYPTKVGDSPLSSECLEAVLPHTLPLHQPQHPCLHLKSHSGLSVASAGLPWLIQALIKRLPGIIQHAAHPREERPQNAPRRGVLTGYKGQSKNAATRKHRDSMAWSVCGLGPGGRHTRSMSSASKRQKPFWRDLFWRWDPALQIM